MEFHEQWELYRQRVEEGIDWWVFGIPANRQLVADWQEEASEQALPRLQAAVRYSLKAGGKRLRPILVLLGHAQGCSAAVDPLPAAAAVECVHTYSLIHDDLPCMDDSPLRRSLPSCHVAFDEATAVLAGDALLTHAFAVLSRAYVDRPALALALIRELSLAADGKHLLAGQMEDLLSTGPAADPSGTLRSIHEKKTAALFQAALLMGGRLAELEPSALETLRRIGHDLGLAFQIVDDVLDLTGDTAVLGKNSGTDTALNY